MYRVLIVDDEKIEREGIKFLLEKEEGEQEIYEASNGKQALNILRMQDIDLLLTDIKMPHMDGLELAREAREISDAIQIVIFSGYSDFSFAQEAIHYGVTDYVLKPVDPERFHDTVHKAKMAISRRKKEKQQAEKDKSFLQQYFLQSYLYSGKEEILEKAGEMIALEEWDKWHCAILVETDQAFFDMAPDSMPEDIQEELRRKFFYLNLNTRQSILLFNDIYCDY